MPRALQPGVLYVSDEYGTAAHLCACGCGSKIRTPLGPTDWELVETKDGPSLFPSIGNWQQECQSHYWIDRGQVRWAAKWSREQIEAGRRDERERAEAHFTRSARERRGPWSRFWSWIIRQVRTRRDE